MLVSPPSIADHSESEAVTPGRLRLVVMRHGATDLTGKGAQRRRRFLQPIPTSTTSASRRWPGQVSCSRASADRPPRLRRLRARPLDRAQGWGTRRWSMSGCGRLISVIGKVESWPIYIARMRGGRWLADRRPRHQAGAAAGGGGAVGGAGP